jgi:hypothetical protein
MPSWLQLILGAVIAIVVAIWVEYLRRPRLRLLVETPPIDTTYSDRPAKHRRGVRLKVCNEPLPIWAQWMVRAPALQCRGTITFHHLDGQNVFGRSMEARWAGSLEPVPIPVVNSEGKQEFQILDPRLNAESRTDVYPGEFGTLDVAVRLDEDEDCYGWNNESYLSAWRNPNWTLQHGRYLVSVTISSSGQKCVGLFRLLNDVPRTDFRLEYAAPNDKVA